MARSVQINDVLLTVGDTIKIHYAIKDKDKKKNQIFEGIVLSVRGRGNNKMFTVRKVTRSNIGVERIFPAISPFIEKIEIANRTTNTRANIEYIRSRSRREIKEKLYSGN
jgi:large subunit ribosomal protein L19